MQRMVTAPIPLYSPSDITRAQSRAGGWIASFDFDGACTSTPSLPTIASTNESPSDSSTTTSTLTGPFCCNHQYCVTAITTSTGAIAERYAYTAYGQPIVLNASGTPLSPQTSTLNSRYSYTGREWDSTLGLHHFRARWVSPSAGRFLGRDPIGYFAGPSLVRFLKHSPLSALDPSGLFLSFDPEPGDKNDEVFELDPDWFVNIYTSQFGCAPGFYQQGCIGIVRDIVGKSNLADGTECYSFHGDVPKTLNAAQGAFSSKKCPKCHFPIIFAFNYWTNGKGPDACKTCGRVKNPTFPPPPDPSSTGIPFDFCVRMLDDQWIGGNHGHSSPGPKILVWPSLQGFAGAYKNYDTTVVCVTCTGDEYQKGGTLGLFPHKGSCTEEQLRGLTIPPFLYPDPWNAPTR